MPPENQHAGSAAQTPRLSAITEAFELKGRLNAVQQSVEAAYAHWCAGQNQQAELICLQILVESPEHAPALHLLGLIAHTFGRLPEAVEYMRRSCAWAKAPSYYHSNFAEICRQAGHLEDAECAARRALELEPDNIGAQGNLGIILQEAGKLDEALILLQHVTTLDPDNPQMRNNLGNTLQRAGKLLEAKEAYSAAITLNPEYDSAYANLAYLLGNLGDFDAGLDATRQAIEINPQCSAAYLQAATIHLKRRNFHQALRSIDALLNFMPAHLDALKLRIKLLIELDELDEAEQIALHVLNLEPDGSESSLLLAKVLQAQNRDEEALALFKQAVHSTHNPTSDAPIALAEMLIQLGRLAEAEATLRTVLAQQPETAAAWAQLATIKTFTHDDVELDAMSALLANETRSGMAFEDRVSLHFALGKAYLDCNKVERALDHYAQANQLRRSQATYDEQIAKQWMASIAQQVQPALLQALSAAGAGYSSDIPVFIVGMPRSGTSLVEQILASHPEVFGAGELTLVQKMVDRIIDQNGAPLPYPELLSQLTAEDFSDLGAYYTQTVAALASDKRRIVDKMPLNFLYAPFIHLMLPNARIIHMQRDPVDTCMSCYCQAFSPEQGFTFDLAELGNFYVQYSALMQQWRALLPSSRFMEIRYEDVVEDLEGSARRLIDFCGLAWDDACLSFHQTKRRVRTASLAQVRRPIYRDDIGRWLPHTARLSPLLEALRGRSENV